MILFELMNKTNKIIFALSFALILFPAYAYPESAIRGWPKLEGNLNTIECNRAFGLAKAAFQSDQLHLTDFFKSDKTPISDMD